MQDFNSSKPPSPQPPEFRKKDGSYSRMRAHAGNTPVLPQSKLCPFCPAKFTRTTHLNRHLRNHTNERVHKCELCEAQFTRSDLLSRHKRGCNNQTTNARRKSCVQCSESKVKCDRELPCSKCRTRGKQCVYAPATKKVHRNRYSTTQATARGSIMISQPTVELDTKKTNVSDSDLPVATGSASISINPNHALNDPSNSFSATPADYSNFTDQGSDYSRHYPSVTSTESSSQIPINSHLVCLYNHDVFEQFFSGVFSTGDYNSSNSSSSAVSRELSPNTTFGDYLWGNSYPGQNEASTTQFTMQNNDGPLISPSAYSQYIPNPTETFHEQELNDRRYYLHLFFTGFIEQIPVVHAPSFGLEGKPSYLIHAMEACGAIYVKSKTAASFMSTTLETSRQSLYEELSKDSLTIEDQLNLILTMALLHTLGMFNEDAKQRAAASISHGMLISMIRRVQFIPHVNDWSMNDYSSTSLEAHWRQWAWHEMSKRVLLLTYLQDISQCIYFTVPASYHNAELTFGLPCDDKLWNAQSASEWWTELNQVSPYGSSNERLTCPTLPDILQLVFAPQATPMRPLSHYAHWAVIHAVVGHLFNICTNGRLHLQASGSSSNFPDQELYGIQFALHNWIQWWMKRPEAIDPTTLDGTEPPFMLHPLPFYWLGQVALMAYQENLPPFDDQVYPSVDLRMEVRFWQVKKWLRHIRSFLGAAQGIAPTILWDELMNIRLQSWQVNLDHPAHDDPHGLLGFFVQ
ncbi:hypothetical protein F5880DRAFT_1745416 [Lentinula raphanica]|nr:hypothetical protein F5880DRAFT_1745416 [Lentinula raphanica]